MAVLPTFDELYSAARAEIQARRPDLTDFSEGSVLDSMAGAAAVLADEVIRVSVEQFAELFFDTAEGDALDRLALDRFGIVRNLATASIGVVEWTRDSAGAYTILAGTRFQSEDGLVTVQSTSAVQMLATDTTVAIPVQGIVAGRASNAAADTITVIMDRVLVDQLATCTNPQPIAGGAEAESDEAFRDRIRRIYSTLRRGTRAALETGALSVPGVGIVTVDESAVETSGHVAVYVGDPDARANDTLAGLVTTELELWRAAGIQVDVYGSEREERELSIRIAVEAGSDQTAVGDAIRATVVAYGNTLAAGEKARISRIQEACHAASDPVVAANILTETDDLVPLLPQNAIRFVADQIAISFVEV
ncbi:MAG: baseplate J/gp47 family protein [Novosphingobium sp.]